MTLPGVGKKKQPQRRAKSNVLFGFGGGSGKKSFAGERIQKMIKERTIFWVRFIIFGSIGGIILLIVLGALAGAALSLKTGGTLTGVSFIEDQLRKSPIGQFLPKPPEVQSYDVIGLPGIPEYPKSEFAFASSVNRTETSFEINLKGYSDTDQQELYRFLSSGESVYFMPVSDSWSDVVKYYQDELPKKGWQAVGSVGVTDLERIPGEYFVKEDQGLHLYTVAEDIWYEFITKEQAANGLKDRIVAYKTKQLLVSSASGNEFPQETWWALRYTNDWEFTMTKHLILGEQIVTIRNKKTPARISISPLKRYKDNPADVDYNFFSNLGREHLKTWVATQPPSVSLSDFVEKNLTIDGVKAVEFASPKNKAFFAFMINNKNQIVYVIEYFGDSNTDFYEYLKLNLKSVKK